MGTRVNAVKLHSIIPTSPPLTLSPPTDENSQNMRKTKNTHHIHNPQPIKSRPYKQISNGGKRSITFTLRSEKQTNSHFVKKKRMARRAPTRATSKRSDGHINLLIQKKQTQNEIVKCIYSKGSKSSGEGKANINKNSLNVNESI